MSARFLYDSNVFVYSFGRDHPYRDACRDVVVLAQEGALAGEASIEMVQEVAHVLGRRGRDRAWALQRAADVAELCRLHAFEPSDLPLVMTLAAHHPELEMRDAVMAATALNRGIPTILSADRAFDAVDGLRRVDPLDEAAVAELAR